MIDADKAKTKKAREDMEKLIISLILAIIGYGLIGYYTNWKVSVAAGLVVWANNITLQMRLDSKIEENNKVVATGIANLFKSFRT